MKQGYAHLCVALDASSSTSSFAVGVKEAFERFFERQRTETASKTVVDVYQYADEPTRIVRSEDLATGRTDLMSEYRPSGCTALCDALCDAIDELGRDFAAMREEDRPELVVVAIMSDGVENASRRRTEADVRARIELQRWVYNWRFLFLGANMDAQAVGTALGIPAGDCFDFDATDSGVVEAAQALGDRVAALRKERFGG